MPLKEINILRRHGRQYVPDLRRVELRGIFRGRPVISGDITVAEAELMTSLCPVGAIGVTSVASGMEHGMLAMDLGKCVFCRECEFAFPHKIGFTNDFKMATNIRERLLVVAGTDQPVRLDPEMVRKEFRSFFKLAL